MREAWWQEALSLTDQCFKANLTQVVEGLGTFKHLDVIHSLVVSYGSFKYKVELSLSLSKFGCLTSSPSARSE